MTERLMLRIETDKQYYEYGTPLLIFVDDVGERGLVYYCSATGHGYGQHQALIAQSRPMTKEEIESFHGTIYGYNLNDFKIVKRR